MLKNQQEIDRLMAVDKELKRADGEFEHQQRRFGDQKERNGGIDRGAENILEQIKKNRKRIAEERKKIAMMIANLRSSSRP